VEPLHETIAREALTIAGAWRHSGGGQRQASLRHLHEQLRLIVSRSQVGEVEAGLRLEQFLGFDQRGDGVMWLRLVLPRIDAAARHPTSAETLHALAVLSILARAWSPERRNAERELASLVERLAG
jgi:hypothetical protein